MELYNVLTGEVVAEIGDEFNSVSEFMNTMNEEEFDSFIEATGGRDEIDYAFMERVYYRFAKQWVGQRIVSGTYDETTKTVCVYFKNRRKQRETKANYKMITGNDPA